MIWLSGYRCWKRSIPSRRFRHYYLDNEVFSLQPTTRIYLARVERTWPAHNKAGLFFRLVRIKYIRYFEKTMRSTLPRKIATTTLIVSSVIIRLLPHPANFTPVGATALFGGAKLTRPWNYLAPIAVMAVTDIFLGWHRTMIYVYVSLILITFIGERTLTNKGAWPRVGLAAIAGSLLFFFITNFGVWESSNLYPHTAIGLYQSYLMGLPFLRNMLAGDVLFSLSFFGIVALVENRVIVPRQLVTVKQG